jgi:hypothetical protein
MSKISKDPVLAPEVEISMSIEQDAGESMRV